MTDAGYPLELALRDKGFDEAKIAAVVAHAKEIPKSRSQGSSAV
jgi:hypothetical protein